MTDSPKSGPQDVAPHTPRPAIGALLDRALGWARWTILWERVWPPLAALATVGGLFLAVSWLGLWLWLPPMGRAVGLFAFAVATAAATAPLLFVRFPSQSDALSRLDRVSGLPHRPATTVSDQLATSPSDPWSVALWQAHLARSHSAIAGLRAGRPAPRLMLRDPFAVRGLVLVFLIATFFAAGGERTRRIFAAFDWQGVVAPANFRVDAWVSPPNYTGKPPIILPGMRPGEAAQAQASAVTVPAGSVLVIRASGKADFDITTSGGLTEVTDDNPQPPAGTQERRFIVTDRSTATLGGLGDGAITWAFNATADKTPKIALAKDPEPQSRGSLQLSYKIEDDYGVVGADALFSLKAAPQGQDAPRPLFEAPEFHLGLPQPRTRNGAGQTTKDVSEHPWAGADVTLTLTARDEGNNEGRSEPFAMKLPERMFTKPLARAVIEQRRNLALDANAKDRVLIALDALAIAPDKFTTENGTYLGLRSIYWSVANAKNDDQAREAVAEMWAFATQLEDGNVSEAEKALRAAQDALRQALERGASDEELKKLMNDLRAAIDKFMQAMAEELRKNPQMARPLDQNSRQLRTQDLRAMLDKMEQLARSGAKDAARQMLDQLQSMLDNLQMARPGQQGDGDDDMMSSLDELGNMIRKQQQLRDKTFKQGQDQRRGQQRGQRGQRGQQGQQGQQGDEQGDPNAFGDLKQNQQALRDQLKKLMEEMKKKGFGQNQDGQQGQQGQPGQGGDDPFGQAGDAMGDAGDSLGEGNADGAVGNQGKALDALRKGAQNLAQQMQQQMGQGPGPGQPGRNGPARAQQDTDPLGRPLRGRDYGDDVTVKVPGEIESQRARRILEELRRRFGESFRPQLELDYLERLLKDF